MILDNFFEPRKKSVVEATMSPGSPALAVPKAPRAPAAPALAAPKTPAAPAPQSNRQYAKTYNAQTKQWTTNAPAANPMSQDPAQRTQNLQAAQAQAAQPDADEYNFDSWEQEGNMAVPLKNGVRQGNLFAMPVSQVPQGSNITQKYNNYQQQGDSAYPVEPNGGIQQLAKIPVGQVPKGANITQMPTPGGNLYKDLPGAGTLEEQDQPIDKELVKQIYKNNRDIIGPNPNLIYPKTIIDLPDGTPYEIQPGDTLSKIARKLPVIKAAAQSQIAQAVAPTDAVAAEPSFMDKLKQAASGLAAGQLPSQAIPAAFPSLKKPAPAAPAAATSGTIVNPDWSQTKYNNLGPLVKGSDGVWRTQDGKMSAADPEIIAMADKLATSKAAPAPVVKKPPEKVAPADSLDSDEQIVVKSKFKRPKTPYVPTPRPTGKEPPPTATPTGIPAAAEKTGRVVDKVEKSAKQAIDWIGDKIADRAETRGSKSPYTQKNILGSSAYGRYQFMPDTFDGLVKLAKPGDLLYGKTWKDFKKDPKLQDETMRVADVYYTDVLSRNKIPTTDGNKYLSHFVGAENAVGMINNMPETTPLKNIYKDRTSKDGTTIKLKDGTTIPNKFFTKNNFSTDMTVGDLRKWADAKIAPPAKKKTKESTVAETVHTVKVMLETATTRDDVRRIKDYIDRQYTRHGLSDSVSFAQRNHLVERVIEITGKRLLLT